MEEQTCQKHFGMRIEVEEWASPKIFGGVGYKYIVPVLVCHGTSL